MKKLKRSSLDTAYGPGLRGQRTRLGVSLREFARLAEIHPTYLSKIELGHLPAPSAAVRKRIDHLVVGLLTGILEQKKEQLLSLESEVFEDELSLIDLLVTAYVHKPRFRNSLLQQLRRLVELLEAEDPSTSSPTVKAQDLKCG